MSVKRLTVHVTPHEMKLIEALIQEHYMETGIVLSKSNFCRAILLPHFADGQKLFEKKT
mgnify:CR=1 FL=1|tara:strand:+ start:976 stop:1152 length:177 start_codon:yes stop_codon:yes gene_type:complete